jgi:O-antigen/teichoic acid export membrane protein
MRLLTQAASLLILARALGPSNYGLLAAATSLAVILGIIPSLGAGYVLLSRLEGDDRACQDVWSYSWPLTTMIGITLTVPYAWACRSIAGSMSINTHLLVLLGLSELIFTPLTLILSFVAQAKERVPLSQVLQWVPFALKLVAALVALTTDSSMRLGTYIYAQCIASLSGTLLAWIAARRLAGLTMSPRLPRRKDLTSGSSYGLMHLVAANPSELDKILSLRALGTLEAGIYSVSSRIIGAMVMPVTALLLSVQTRLFRQAAADKGASMPLIRQVGAASALWGICSAGALAISARWLPTIFGEAFERTASFIPLLSVAAPFMALRISAGTVLVSHGHPFLRTAFELAGAALLCICMIIFASRHGLNGAAAALILAEATMAAGGWALLLRESRTRSAQSPAGN